MGSLAGLQAEIDAEIFEEIGETLLTGSERVPGVFVRRHRELLVGPGGGAVGVDMSFDCTNSAVVEALTADSEVRIELKHDDGSTQILGPYRFIRRLPRGGDETGLTIIELGEFKT